MILILTILNSIGIVYILFKLIIKVSIQRNETFDKKTLYRYTVFINDFSFRIPIRNEYKIKLNEEVTKMIGTYDNQQKLQVLSAKFSWLNTWEEVRKFEKEYSVVDRKIVENLVNNFKPRK